MIDVICENCSPIKRQHVERAVPFYLKLLLPRLKNVRITIQFVTNLQKEEGVLADCDVDDHESARPKEFIIRVDNGIRLCHALTAIAHEIVHVKQYASGQLVFTGNVNIETWNGKNVDSRKFNYWDLPWEIDAYGREKGLFTRYIEKYKFDAEDWTELNR
jgi:hypothetical protein